MKMFSFLPFKYINSIQSIPSDHKSTTIITYFEFQMRQHAGVNPKYVFCSKKKPDVVQLISVCIVVDILSIFYENEIIIGAWLIINQHLYR